MSLTFPVLFALISIVTAVVVLVAFIKTTKGLKWHEKLGSFFVDIETGYPDQNRTISRIDRRLRTIRKHQNSIQKTLKERDLLVDATKASFLAISVDMDKLSKNMTGTGEEINDFSSQLDSLSVRLAETTNDLANVKIEASEMVPDDDVIEDNVVVPIGANSK